MSGVRGQVEEQVSGAKAGVRCQASSPCARAALLRMEDSSQCQLGHLARMFFIIKRPLGAEQVDENCA